jgi:hypothetical protein
MAGRIRLSPGATRSHGKSFNLEAGQEKVCTGPSFQGYPLYRHYSHHDRACAERLNSPPFPFPSPPACRSKMARTDAKSIFPVLSPRRHPGHAKAMRHSGSIQYFVLLVSVHTNTHPMPVAAGRVCLFTRLAPQAYRCTLANLPRRARCLGRLAIFFSLLFSHPSHSSIVRVAY